MYTYNYEGMSLYAAASMSACSEIPSAFLAAWMLETPWLSEGGTIRLETLIELKFLNPSLSSFLSC